MSEKIVFFMDSFMWHALQSVHRQVKLIWYQIEERQIKFVEKF